MWDCHSFDYKKLLYSGMQCNVVPWDSEKRTSSASLAAFLATHAAYYSTLKMERECSSETCVNSIVLSPVFPPVNTTFTHCETYTSVQKFVVDCWRPFDHLQMANMSKKGRHLQTITTTWTLDPLETHLSRMPHSKSTKHERQCEVERR
jgi:hypothetical protein